MTKILRILSLAVMALVNTAIANAGAGPMPTPPVPERWTASEVACPDGTELRREVSPHSDRSALWCEIRQGSRVARHGPYLELYADGSTARQGLWDRGIQIGPWVEWAPDGSRTRAVEIWPGEAGRHLPQPDDVCPPGSRRERSYGYDDRERMWSECLEPGPEGKPVRVGPYVTWSVERQGGAVRLLLRDVTEYRDGERHGRRRAYDGPSGREGVVLEENFVDGKLHGESRAYFTSGALREVRNYRDGLFDGERVAYRPAGGERWRALYRRGQLIEAEGDLEVAGQPCPGETLPVLAADRREERCERRSGAWGVADGAYARYDATGAVIERGLYRDGDKVEVWDAPPGSEPPPAEPAGVLVAEGRLLVGERPLSDLTAAEPEIWFRDNRSREYPHPRADLAGDDFRVYDLAAGSYYLGVTVDAETSNPERHPGDFTGSLDFEVVDGEVTALEVRLLETLHLLEPWDNREPIPGSDGLCDDTPALPPRLRFAWRPPAGGDDGRTEYVYTVRLMRCDPFQPVRSATDKTWESELVLELEPTGPGEVYSFHLGARRGGVPVGHLMTFGADGSYGWDLRFRVEGESR